MLDINWNIYLACLTLCYWSVCWSAWCPLHVILPIHGRNDEHNFVVKEFLMLTCWQALWSYNCEAVYDMGSRPNPLYLFTTLLDTSEQLFNTNYSSNNNNWPFLGLKSILVLHRQGYVVSNKTQSSANAHSMETHGMTRRYVLGASLHAASRGGDKYAIIIFQNTTTTQCWHIHFQVVIGVRFVQHEGRGGPTTHKINSVVYQTPVTQGLEQYATTNPIPKQFSLTPNY